MGESCSHVGGLLFKIEAAVRLGYTKEVACTIVLKQISGTKIKDIKNSTELKKNPPAKRFMPATASQQECILGMLNQIPDRSKLVRLSLYADYSESFHHKAQVPQTPKIRPSVREFYNPKLSEEQIENQVKPVHELKLCSEKIKFTEKPTVLRSNSIVWKSLGAGQITASNTPHQSKWSSKKSCTEGKKLNHVSAIKREHENEGNALKAYQKILDKNHSGVVIEKCGLLMHEKYHFLGVSPDVLVTCLCHESSLLEIKCPAKHKDNLSISDCYCYR